MKKIITKLYNMSSGQLYFLLALTAFTANYRLWTMTMYHSGSGYYQMLSGMNGALATTIVFTSLLMALFIMVLVRIWYFLFGKLYARSFVHGSAMISVELPISKIQFLNTCLMFIILYQIVMSLVRIFYFFSVEAYYAIEYVVSPLVIGTFAIGGFFVAKKYLLQPRIVYNAYAAFAIPFVLFYIFM